MDQTGQRMLDDLLTYCLAEDRVCPLPIYWDQLWKLLPGRARSGNGWEPPPPLILAAWYSSPEKKRDRLRLHLEWAAQRGALDEVSRFLMALKHENWLHDPE